MFVCVVYAERVYLNRFYFGISFILFERFLEFLTSTCSRASFCEDSIMFNPLEFGWDDLKRKSSWKNLTFCKFFAYNKV